MSADRDTEAEGLLERDAELRALEQAVEGACAGRGGAVVIEPSSGDVIAGPLYGEEGIVTADCDLRVGLHAKRWFDCVGHYSRADVLPHELVDVGGPLD